jgi:Zn-dependent protease with chaperone function
MLMIWASSALIVWGVAKLWTVVFGGSWAMWAVAVWTAVGFLSWTRQVEGLFAKWTLKFREPLKAERAVLEPAWANVCAKAQIDPSNYDLWIDDDPELNAAAAGAHIVGVTRGALTFPPQQLEAILAHEYGHHVGGHVRVLSLQLWYVLPLQTVARFLPFPPV